MSGSPPSLSPRGTSPRASKSTAFLTKSALDRVGWTPPGVDLMTGIPGYTQHLPMLDGEASIAVPQPARALDAGPTPGVPLRRLVHRLNATNNIHSTVARGSSSGTPTPVDANGLVLRFEHCNIRSNSGATPPRQSVNPPDSSESGALPPASTPAQEPVLPSRTADDVAHDVEERALLQTKQCLTDRFLCYHASLEHWMYWNRDKRKPQWTQFPIPLHGGEWPGHPLLRQGEELDALMSYQLRLLQDPQRLGTVRGIFNRVRRPLNRVRRLIGRPRDGGPEDSSRRKMDRLNAHLVSDFAPAGIRFKRRLGQGGFGAVFLFEMMGEKDSTYPIVVKGSTREMLDDSDALGDEINNLNWMNGASHFIQRVFLQDLPLPTASRRRKVRLAARKGMATVCAMTRQTGDIIQDFTDGALLRRQQPRPEIRQVQQSDDDDVLGYTTQEVEKIQRHRLQLDNARNIIMLENMPRGDIQELINKLVKKKMRLSNRALWKIFECLFKGCVGMTTPGRFHKHGQDANAHAMMERDETVPDGLHDGTQLPAWPMVHFDLDPQNALVGIFEESGGAHENVPIVKLADPGLAIIMDDDKRNNESLLWNLRCRGKTQYLQPEQFTREWDYHAAIDLANLTMESTAGNYNWWSNLYQIGWIMWSLVTHCFPPVPPRAWPYSYASEEPGVVEDGHGHTYGMHIMAADFTYCDLELRRQILRCLDHDPTQRPKLGWFEAVFMYNVERPDLLEAESDEQLRAHMCDVYGQPVSTLS